MKQAGELVLFAALMFAATTGIGLLPSILSISQRTLNRVGVFGAGLLVGVALIVVIPEGMAELAKHLKGGAELLTGLALVSGFAIMMAIDRTFEALEQGRTRKEKEDDEEESLGLVSRKVVSPKEEKQSQILVTTIGLVIHSLCDGLALGSSVYAASLKGNSGLDVLIFFALLCHKIPATIGFSSFMKFQQIEQTNEIRYLLSFTSSSPISAILTYIFLTTVRTSMVDSIVGFFLLVSGGSFLYVALLHILPEVTERTKGGSLEDKKRDGLLMMTGLLSPLLLSLLE